MSSENLQRQEFSENQKWMVSKMTTKSIDYEVFVSSLIDVFAVSNSRNEDIDIKRSFSTKQIIYSNILHDRLLSFISGDDYEFKIILEKLFDIIQESMKTICSSPFILKMEILDFNKIFREQFVFPFIGLLFFYFRDKIPVTSPLFYFNEFIENNNGDGSVDAIVRSYLKGSILNADLSNIERKDVNFFINTITINSSLKINKTKELINSLINPSSNNCELKNTLSTLSLRLYAMRIVLVYKEYIHDIKKHHEYAKNNSRPENVWYWDVLKLILSTVFSNNLLLRLHSINNNILPHINRLSIMFYNQILSRFKIDVDRDVISLINGNINREDIVKLLSKSKFQNKDVYNDILCFYLKIYDGCFGDAIIQAEKIIKDNEVFPKCRLTSNLSKIVLALVVKVNGSKIKNNGLERYVYRIISSDIFRLQFHSELNSAFMNIELSCFNDAYTYTIIDSLMEWKSLINEKLQIEPSVVASFDIVYLDKTESILNKIYCELDNQGVCLSSINETSLREILRKCISHNERTGNLISFMPKMNLYFILRDLSFIMKGVGSMGIYNLPCIIKFICDEFSESKRKLLKVIDADQFKIDEENELSLNPLF